MKQLFYTISYLKNAWGNNLIKVFTLTLGLAIGLILFARISFDLSYDKFLPDAENIYQVQMIYTTGVGTETSHSTEQCYSFQPIAPTMPLEIPGVVAGTSTTGNGERVIFEGENRYTVKAILADTMFFKTLPFKILSLLLIQINIFFRNSNLSHSDYLPILILILSTYTHISIYHFC